MKRIFVTFVLLLTVFKVAAQNEEYNLKGDEARKNLDYSSAKIWYEDGVVLNCNIYSITQLTEIWTETDQSVRNTMRSVMARSLKCLDDRATFDTRDTTSIKMLILYYENGIGTDVNETKAEMWQSILDNARYPDQNINGQKDVNVTREKAKMEFFLGYAATFEAPYGITFGGVGRTVGWYLRFRTNLSSQNFSKTFDGEGDNINIAGGINGGLLNCLPNEKVNTLIATGGFMFKVAPSFYLSVGGGYCKREYLREFQIVSDVDIDAEPKETFWAKSNSDSSFDGKVALDLDGTLKIGKTFYGSLGCSVLSFKYVSANAGIGVFF